MSVQGRRRAEELEMRLTLRHPKGFQVALNQGHEWLRAEKVDVYVQVRRQPLRQPVFVKPTHAVNTICGSRLRHLAIGIKTLELRVGRPQAIHCFAKGMHRSVAGAMNEVDGPRCLECLLQHRYRRGDAYTGADQHQRLVTLR